MSTEFTYANLRDALAFQLDDESIVSDEDQQHEIADAAIEVFRKALVEHGLQLLRRGRVETDPSTVAREFILAADSLIEPTETAVDSADEAVSL